MFRAFFLGISIGLLFAPKAGKEMRAGISNLFTDLKENGTDKISDLEAKSSEYVESISRRLIEAGEKGAQILERTAGEVEKVRHTSSDAISKVNDKLAHVSELGEEGFHQALELKKRVLEAGRQSWEKAKEVAESNSMQRRDDSEKPSSALQMKSQGDAKTEKSGAARPDKDELKTRREIAEGQETRAEEMRKQEDFMDDGASGTLERGSGEPDAEKAERAKAELDAENSPSQGQGEEESNYMEFSAEPGAELGKEKAEELAAKLNSHHVATPEHRDVA